MGKYFPILSFVIVALISSSVNGQEAKRTERPSPSGLELLSEQDIVKSKNYYLLSLLQENAVKKVLTDDPSLQALTTKKKEQLHSALKNCKDTGCLLDAMRFTDGDIDTAAVVLSKLYRSSPALSDLVRQKLRPSKAYYQFNQLSLDKEFIEAWKQDIKGVNYTIDVYGGGKKPNYPNIDSIAFNVKSRSYMNLLYDVVIVKFFHSAFAKFLIWRLKRVRRHYFQANNTVPIMIRLAPANVFSVSCSPKNRAAMMIVRATLSLSTAATCDTFPNCRALK